jgi:hypothetical protein
LNVELQQYKAQGAAMFVEFDLKGINQKFAQLVDAGVLMQDDLVKYTAELFKRIVMRTPVRTGRAKNSWHWLPPNTPNDDYTYTVPAGPHVPEPITYDGSLSGVKTGPWDAVVGSNVEYMLSLEAGHSRQAPQGMVSISLLELSGALAKTLEKRLRDAARS